MLPRVDASISPVTRVDPAARAAPVADARQEALQRALSGEIGKTLQGEVLSKLTDGSFLVKVAGASARMMLPEGAQPGQQVPLTLVALSPRPTFEVATRQGPQTTFAFSSTDSSPDLGAAAAETDAQPAPLQKPISYAAALLARAPLTPSHQLTSIDPKSTPATLSETGRSIANVMGRAAASAPTALVTATPLAAPGAPPVKIAAALAQSLSESGLFYESHVAEWSSGERPLESLAREPQMARAAAAQANLPPMPAAPEPARMAREAQPIDQEAARFINFQLNTQEQGRVAWEGQPWPGQAMRWEVARDAPERQQGGIDELDPPWRSGIRLHFPLLGDIEAKVIMHGGQLHIQVDAGSGATGELLRGQVERLSRAMGAAGLALTSLNIRDGAEGDSHE